MLARSMYALAIAWLANSCGLDPRALSLPTTFLQVGDTVEQRLQVAYLGGGVASAESGTAWSIADPTIAEVILYPAGQDSGRVRVVGRRAGETNLTVSYAGTSARAPVIVYPRTGAR